MSEDADSMSEEHGTRVLHGGGPLGRAAPKMLPKLPAACFVQATDLKDAVRQAAEDGVIQLILFATAESLDQADVQAPLAEITTDMGGSPLRAAETGSIRAAYEQWDEAGLLGKCGRELCRRVADDLERTAGAAFAAQVVLLDPAAERMIGMYGRLRR
ncbi:hypothetical protein [Actinomadura sp. 9N407]|uniref:hypothetical protein n=1 Tax=Actinomadura sp. 9N407 TaxID=3375154 RepID=UPI0037B6C34D